MWLQEDLVNFNKMSKTLALLSISTFQQQLKTTFIELEGLAGLARLESP